MTETETVKKKRSLIVPIALLIVTIAVAGFLASRAGLDKALVKQQLDQFIGELKEKGHLQGREVDLTYGDLEVVGSFASKHVVIHNPVFSMKPMARYQRPQSEKKRIDAVVITTPSVEVYPQARDLSSLRLQFPEPINVAGADAPDQSLLKVTSNVPPVVTLGRETKDATTVNQLGFQAPTQMTLTYLREQQAKGEEEKTPTLTPVYETLDVQMAQGSGFSSALTADKAALGKVSVFFRGLVLTPKEAPDTTVKVTELTGEWTNTLNDKNLNTMHVAGKVGPVTSEKKDAPYFPIALAVDATYEGAMPKTPEAVASIQSSESSLVLKTFTLTTKDANLGASADFKVLPKGADLLPVGTAKLSVTNVPYVLTQLRDYGAIKPEQEPLLTALLERITGQKMAEIKDVEIPVNRVRGGAFTIGKTSFEELLALVLQQAVRKPGEEAAPAAAVPSPGVGQPPLVPQLPPADKPKAAPIAVPDHGVRG